MISGHSFPFLSCARNRVFPRIQKPKGSCLLAVESGVCGSEVEGNAICPGTTVNASHRRCSNVHKINLVTCL